MIADLSELLAVGQRGIWIGFAVFIRIGAMMAILPAFGEQSVPTRVRIAATLALTALVAPIVESELGVFPGTLGATLVRLSGEVLVGLFFGLALRFFVFVLQIAGSIIAQSTSLSQIFGGSAGVDPQPAMGRILVVAGLALAATYGLHVKFVLYILDSYVMVPFGALISSENIVSLGVTQVTHTFALGFSLSAPFLVASLIYNVTLGVINRAMPQLMVSFVGAPAITAGGLVLMAISAPVLLSIWLNAFNGFIVDPFGSPR